LLKAVVSSSSNYIKLNQPIEMLWMGFSVLVGNGRKKSRAVL